MAQENSPDKEKRQGRTKKPEKPYVEQIDELLLVHNKNDPKEGLGVVSKADEKGNYQTVAPEEKNENSFLKFDKNSSILENFIKNFWSQLKEPTHFRLIRMTFNDYKQNKQALKDLAEGKKTLIITDCACLVQSRKINFLHSAKNAPFSLDRSII